MGGINLIHLILQVVLGVVEPMLKLVVAEMVDVVLGVVEAEVELQVEEAEMADAV